MEVLSQGLRMNNGASFSPCRTYRPPTDALAPQSGKKEDVSALYRELLYAVARKWPGESRHQTALRYIQQAEEIAPSSPPSKARD